MARFVIVEISPPAHIHFTCSDRDTDYSQRSSQSILEELLGPDLRRGEWTKRALMTTGKF